MHVLDLLLLIPIVFIWALLPSTLAALAHGIAEYWQSLRFQLPFNRKLEIEADTVGLMLAAKVCPKLDPCKLLSENLVVIEMDLKNQCIFELLTSKNIPQQRHNLKQLCHLSFSSPMQDSK